LKEFPKPDFSRREDKTSNEPEERERKRLKERAMSPKNPKNANLNIADLGTVNGARTARRNPTIAILRPQ
jgi:hypothetical protein